MVKYPLSIHRRDILQVLTKRGILVTEIALATLDEKFPTVLMRAIFPTQLSDQEHRASEKEIAQILEKPVTLRNTLKEDDDELQRLAKFEYL